MKTKFITTVVASVALLAASATANDAVVQLLLNVGFTKAEATKMATSVETAQTFSGEIDGARPHPLSDCEKKRRKITCDSMYDDYGIMNRAELRNNGKTLQFSTDVMTISLDTEGVESRFKSYARRSMLDALPHAAALMGWDLEAPETQAMLADAAMKIEAIMAPDDVVGGDLLRDMDKDEFEGGRIYRGENALTHGYSLYVDEPGYEGK